MKWVASHFLNNHVRRHILCYGKDVILFQRGQIIGLHQAKKTTEEIDESTKTELRTVKHIIKTWTDSGEPSSWRKKCDHKKKNLEWSWSKIT